MNISAKEDFSRWATGYSGCKGNPQGRLWVCGIEYGGNEKEADFVFEDVTKPNCGTDDAFWKNAYNNRFAKLCKGILGQASVKENSANFSALEPLLNEDSNVFKMNLFPISFSQDNQGELWQKWMYEKTGLPTKSIYRAWCQIHRFDKIGKWVKEFNPKLIVATSLSYKDEAIMAFSRIEDIYKIRDQANTTESVDGRPLTWLSINGHKTILAITPFLGYKKHDLNSDQLIMSYGEKLRQICSEQLGADWLSSK